MYEKGAEVGAILFLGILGIFAALSILTWRRRVRAQRVGNAWLFQYSWPFRADMVLCAIGMTGMCSLGLIMYFGHAQPDEKCYCPELALAGFGFFFLLGLYVAVAVFRDQVTLSDQGLTIRGVFSRPATLAWQDIELVSFEWGSFRVRRKGGGSRWISHDLGGNEKLAEYLDQYLYPADPALVPTYVERLRHKNGYVRRGAAVGLSKLGPAATLAVSALVTGLRDNDKAVRSWCAAALFGIGTAAVDARPALLQALTDRDRETRFCAAAALWEVSGEVELALPILVAELRNKLPGTRSWAASILKQMGPQAAPAVPALTARLADPEENVRLWSVAALWAIEGRPEKLLPVLDRLSRSADPEVQEGVRILQGEMSQAVPAAVH